MNTPTLLFPRDCSASILAALSLMCTHDSALVGEYVRVGELGPNSTEEELSRDYTVRHSDGMRLGLGASGAALPGAASERLNEAAPIPAVVDKYGDGGAGEQHWASPEEDFRAMQGNVSAWFDDRVEPKSRL